MLCSHVYGYDVRVRLLQECRHHLDGGVLRAKDKRGLRQPLHDRNNATHVLVACCLLSLEQYYAASGLYVTGTTFSNKFIVFILMWSHCSADRQCIGLYNIHFERSGSTLFLTVPFVLKFPLQF